MKKYKLTEETIEHKCHTLYRIEALKDFGTVRQGDKGGFIESEANLSQDGNCWIGDNAKVYDNAKIYGNAKVYDNAIVSGDAKVYGDVKVFGNAKVYDDTKVFDNAKVYGSAKVCGDAKVYGNAQVYEGAIIFGNAKVFDDAEIYGDAEVFDDAEVCGNAEVWGDAMVFHHSKVFGYASISDNTQVYGNAEVYGNAQVYEGAIIFGNAKVYGNAWIKGYADIGGDAEVERTCDYIVFENWWSSYRHFTWTRSNNKWKVGCFYGTGEELVEKAYKDSELSGREYKRLVDYVESILQDEKGDKKTINYEEFDKECIELCKTLNTMDGLNTTESCCGHLKDNFIIFFRCDNFSTLAKISRSVNKNYSDGKWELLVVDTDTYPCCNFWLRSKEPFKTESEMNESVNELIDNLKYWQKDEFKEYFSNKNNGNYPQ